MRRTRRCLQLLGGKQQHFSQRLHRRLLADAATEREGVVQVTIPALLTCTTMHSQPSRIELERKLGRYVVPLARSTVGPPSASHDWQSRYGIPSKVMKNNTAAQAQMCDGCSRARVLGRTEC